MKRWSWNYTDRENWHRLGNRYAAKVVAVCIFASSWIHPLSVFCCRCRQKDSKGKTSGQLSLCSGPWNTTEYNSCTCWADKAACTRFPQYRSKAAWTEGDYLGNFQRTAGMYQHGSPRSDWICREQRQRRHWSFSLYRMWTSLTSIFTCTFHLVTHRRSRNSAWHEYLFLPILAAIGQNMHMHARLRSCCLQGIALLPSRWQHKIWNRDCYCRCTHANVAILAASWPSVSHRQQSLHLWYVTWPSKSDIISQLQKVWLEIGCITARGMLYSKIAISLQANFLLKCIKRQQQLLSILIMDSSEFVLLMF